jgi:hypothetical protein
MRAMASVDRPLLVALAAVLVGCSYDWSISQAAPDAGSDVSTRPDAEVGDASEAGTTDATSSGSDSGGMGSEDTGTSTVDSPPSCTTLTQDLRQAREVAITCQPLANMPCTSTVTDECGCQLVVGGDPMNTTSFENTLAAFTAASCSTAGLCPGTCPMVFHECLAVDGGASYQCFQ